MSDSGGEAPSRGDQGRTQTGRALVLVVVVALVAVVVLRHTGSSAAGPARSARTAGATSATTTTTIPTHATHPTHPTTSTTVAALIPPSDTTVEVLNGLQVGPLAGNLSGRLRLDGYKTLAPDNATTVTTTSAIYVVESAYYPEATRLATVLGLTPAAIQITRGVPAGAPVPTGVATGSDLIVVIGTSLQALASHSVTPTTTSTSTTTVPSSTSTSSPSTKTSTSSTSTSTAAKTSTAKSTSTTAP